MGAKAILVSAVMFGALAGYAWSALPQARPAPGGEVETRVPERSTATIIIDPGDDADDREWAARGGGLPAARPGRPAPAPRSVASQDSVYYSGCNEVRAAGKAPLYAGEPGYRSGLDGDSDGIACEPYRGR